MPAAALRTESAFHPSARHPSRDDVLARYRQFRKASAGHSSAILASLTQSMVLQQARRLGLARGKTFILESMDELVLPFDLVIYTSPPGRSRAIDRYARSAQPAPGSEDAIVLDAMREARFAILKVLDRHPAAGLIVADVFRDTELWLVDEGLEKSLPVGTAVATRYFSPEDFAMTAGIALLVDRTLLADALALVPPLCRMPDAEAIQDRRFAEAIYRLAVEDGIAAAVGYAYAPGTGEAA